MIKSRINDRTRPPMNGAVWEFRTKNFRVVLKIEREHNPIYDGDDEDGEVQSKLDDETYISFDSEVSVYFRDEDKPLASDYLGSSVYGWDDFPDFWRAHRSADPMNRNCEEMREVRGPNCCIGHYFPDMVREAISAARDAWHERIRDLPTIHPCR